MWYFHSYVMHLDFRTYFQHTRRIMSPSVICNRSEADQCRVTRRFQVLSWSPSVSLKKNRFVSKGSSESASSRPWKYFFVRVTRVPSRTRRGAPFWVRPTRLFARGQTSHRGLPGNCWKHLASVYSVIEARSHLGDVQVLWKSVFCHKRSDARFVVWPLRNFKYERPSVSSFFFLFTRNT